MSENALATLDLSQLPSTRLGSMTEIAKLAQAGSYLQYVKLYTKGEAIDTGKIRPGHWGIPAGDEIVDLGEQIDVLPIAVRPKALDTSDRTAIVVSYDPASEEFKRIHAQAAKPNSGCQVGLSYLVYERGTRRFLEVFFGNKSGRQAASDLLAYLPLTQADIDKMVEAGADASQLAPQGSKPATLRNRLARNDKVKASWHAPVVGKCSTPFTALPSAETVRDEYMKFRSAKSNDVEKVDETKRHARAR